MDNRLKGCTLTRAMLKRGDRNIWCAVDDYSEEQAMMEHFSNDFTTHIVAFSNGKFICVDGMSWFFAVPIKIVALEPEEVGH